MCLGGCGTGSGMGALRDDLTHLRSAHMTYPAVLRRSLTKLTLRGRHLAGDDRCCARIQQYFDVLVPGDMTGAVGGSGGEPEVRIRQAMEKIEPLTRAILIVVVGRRMSVAEVSRRFGVREERVCRYFRSALVQVAGRLRARVSARTRTCS